MNTTYETRSDAEIVRDMAGGCTLSQVLYTAVELRIADHLEDGPLVCSRLSQLTGAQQQSLLRFLRMMTVVGLLEQKPGGAFSLTGRGELLRASHPASLRNRIRYIGEVSYRAALGMCHAVRSGEPGFDHIFGMPFFEYFSHNPGAGSLFNDLMSKAIEDRSAGVVASYDFSGVKTVVDVGGGNGTLMTAILKAHPEVVGHLFDTASVLDEAHRYLEENGLSARCRTTPGDFFHDSVPAGGDLYILSNILHDWDDAQVCRILGNCSMAMGQSGRLLVIEQIMPDSPLDAPVTVSSDLSMLLLLRGRERTEAEYRGLLDTVGLQQRSVFPFEPSRSYNNRRSNWAIIECIRSMGGNGRVNA